MLIHKGTQTIETQRLILRRAVREDAEPMFRNWASHRNNQGICDAARYGILRDDWESREKNKTG